MPSLRALLTGIIDYAGLFPPAGLPLSEAIHNFARYRRSPDAWMLGRFIIPIGKLADLDAHAVLFQEDPPFLFSVLGTGGNQAAAFMDTLADDLRSIRTFHEQHEGRVLADVMEVRLPTSLLGQEDATRQFLQTVYEMVHRELPGFAFFFEVPVDGELEATIPPVLNAMAAHNKAHSDTIGLKMRTGGLVPDAFPTPAQVAFVIMACRKARVRFKATAGLHHPVRHYNEGVQARMHGFLNLFGSAILAAWNDLDADTVRTILMDEAADHFRFDDTGFAWNDHSAPLAAIEQARRDVAISFGSCSFDEPREDLRALGLLS